MNVEQYFEKRMFDALLELNSGRYKHQYNGIIKWFGDSIRKYAICFLAFSFHAGDLEPIASVLAREGLEITTHTIEPVSNNKLSVSVWIRGIGEEVQS